jgi:hypothetical protein
MPKLKPPGSSSGAFGLGINTKRKEKPMVKLLKFIEGKWRVVDYGVASMRETYTKMGYLVEAM